MAARGAVVRRCRFFDSKWLQSRIFYLSCLLVFAVLQIPACNSEPEHNSPSGIQLQAGAVDDGASFTLQVSGNNLDPSTRAVLIRDIGNRSQLVENLPLWGTAFDIELQDDYAYLAAGTKGLVVVDVSDLNSIGVAGSLELPGRTLQVLGRGGLLVAANEKSGIHLIDITSPTNPRLLASLTGLGRAFALDAVDNLLFVAGGGEGLFVVDISNQEHPVIVSHVKVPGRSLAVRRVGQQVYVGGTRMLSVVDVSDSKNPILLDTLALKDNVFDIEYDGQFLYVLQRHMGLLVVDISLPGRLKVQEQVTDIGNVIRFEIDAGRAYIASNLGLIVLELGAGQPARVLGGVFGESRLTDIAIRDGMVLALENPYGLEVFDLREPQEFGFSRTPNDLAQVIVYDPLERKDEDLSDREWGLKLIRPPELTINRFGNDRPYYFLVHSLSAIQQGPLAYVGTDDGIQLLDMSQSDRPRLIGETADGSLANDLALEGDYLYAAGGAKGLLIYRLDNTGLPVFIKDLPLPGVATALAAEAGLVYLVLQRGGMFIIDVNDPSSPRVLTHLQHPYPLNQFSLASDILLFHGMAYIADGPNGLLLVDVADPRKPTIKALINTSDSSHHLFVQGELLSVADGHGGLQLYDITVAEHPVYIGQLKLPVATTASMIAGNTLAVTAKGPYSFWLDKPVEASPRRWLDRNRMEFGFPARLPAGRYTLRVFNAAGGAELVGAVEIGPRGEGTWQD